MFFQSGVYLTKLRIASYIYFPTWLYYLRPLVHYLVKNTITRKSIWIKAADSLIHSYEEEGWPGAGTGV